MQLSSKGARGMGRIAVCLAFASSAVVLAGPAPALAQQGGQFTVALSGQGSVNGGDRDGQGSARLDLDPQRGTACYEITWNKLDGAVTAFHLHAGRRGSEGPHWIDFFNGQSLNGDQGKTSNCVRSTRENIEAVINDPSAYYLQLHSTAFPDGAVRGQVG
ncbi:MAG: CHRD domain-containing protein [Actinomycetota bacterium]|nr:CHRD domain-containing protein [Actinomycetota bacterium]